MMAFTKRVALFALAAMVPGGVPAQTMPESQASPAHEAASPDQPDAPGAPTGRVTSYEEKGLFHGGYWSREEQPGRWTVNARVYANEQRSRAFLIALYRAAQLVAAEGYGAFKVNGQALKTTSIVYRTGRQDIANYLAILNVVAVGSPSGDQPCVMKDTRGCLVLTTAKAFAIAGPRIGMPTVSDAPPGDASRGAAK